MAFETDIKSTDDWFLGEDKTLRFYTVIGQPIVVAASVEEADTSITVEPLAEDVASSVNIRFGLLTVTTSAAADAGDTTLSIAASAGKVPKKRKGYVVQDLSGWTVKWRLLASPNALLANVILSVDATLINASLGITDIIIADTVLEAITTVVPGTYFYKLWRTDAGFETVLAYGSVVLRG